MIPRPAFPVQRSGVGSGVGLATVWICAMASVFAHSAEKAAPRVQPSRGPAAAVETEEPVYTFIPANNGAGPMWCAGSTSLVRHRDQVFAAGLETLEGVKPLHNVRWTLFERQSTGWILRLADPQGRTREPSPLALLPGGRVMLSANPTLAPRGAEGGGPARPELLVFQADSPQFAADRLLPQWDGEPPFSEHSYRSLATDGRRGELILLQNIGYTHAEWAFLDRHGTWAAHGQLPWPKSTSAAADSAKPVRLCYPNVALRDRSVHFFGVSDIIEPNPEWRAFKKQLTGNDWDYDFRRLFYTWTPDVAKQGFRPWIEVATLEATAGFLWPNDLWLAPDGGVHVVWTERAIDERLRERFFPGARQSHSLRYALLRDGTVRSRRTLFESGEGRSEPVMSAARFHATPDGRLFLVYYAGGGGVSENRLAEVGGSGWLSESVVLPLRKPFNSYFTATPRAGSEPSWLLDMLGTQVGLQNTISYARVRIAPRRPPR